MAIYNADALKPLADRMRRKAKVADKALALAINKSATYGIRESIEEITNEVNLKPSYVRRHIKTIARASSNNLRAIIASNTRSTLLARYPYTKTQNGIKVAVNATGGYREIPGARIIKSLSGSGVPAIGVRNKEAVKILEKALSRGKGATGGKTKRLSRVRRRAIRKPYGMTPLKSRSINQLFTDVRETVKPRTGRFMREQFLKDFRRLSI